MQEFDYKKSLGQNFLIDRNIIDNIIKRIDATNDDIIIEIGPGAGALTEQLCLKYNNVYSFEIDKRLDIFLSKIDNAHIIYEDFLKIDLRKFLADKKFNRIYFIGNLPYYITTPIINKIIKECNAEKIVIMIQKEVAQRFMANSGTSDYSSISVHLQYHFNINKVCIVSKNCFKPSPKVDSMVIELTRREKEKLIDGAHFEKIVRDSFAMKRKNLRNNLKQYDLDIIENVLKKVDKNLNMRAEQLMVQEFVNISNELVSKKNISK